jgi:hypothetical protein
MYLSSTSHVNISFSYNEDLSVHLEAVILCSDERIHSTDFYIDEINEMKVFLRPHEFVERRANVSTTLLEVLHSNISSIDVKHKRVNTGVIDTTILYATSNSSTASILLYGYVVYYSASGATVGTCYMVQ